MTDAEVTVKGNEPHKIAKTIGRIKRNLDSKLDRFAQEVEDLFRQRRLSSKGESTLGVRSGDLSRSLTVDAGGDNGDVWASYRTHVSSPSAAVYGSLHNEGKSPGGHKWFDLGVQETRDHLTELMGRALDAAIKREQSRRSA